MIPVKSFINLFILLTVLFTVGCVAKSNSPATTSSPEVVNRLVANNISPASFQSRSQSIITLSYTSIDNELATSCSISQLNKVTVTQACSCDGVGVCNVGVTGEGVYSGAAGFAFNLVAGGKTSTTGKANFSITPPPAGSNVAPTISSIPAKTTNEGVATPAISFTIGDSDSTVNCSNVLATSSNTTVVPTANVVITGSGPTCYVTITPATNQMGSSNIELTLTDTGTPLPAKTATASFTLAVSGFNDPPTISTIATQSMSEDIAKPISFTIGDIDSTVNCNGVTGSSSNQTVVANANIVISGTAPACTVTVTPSLNQSGTANITLSLSDSGVPTAPVRTTTTLFRVDVAAVNDAPVLSTIANQTTDQNVAKAVAFTIADIDSTITCTGNVTATSSNTTLVPNANIVISGTAPNCTATFTPANNESGTSTMTVMITDSGSPMPAATDTKTFVLTVTQINQAPTISTITSKTTNEDTATSAIAFTIADSDAPIYCSNVTGVSSNTTLIPNVNIAITGTAPNCVATITPAANLYGSATITLTVTDNGTPTPSLTATSAFLLTVNAVNDVPTIAAITNKSTDEDTASSAITVTVADIDSTVTCSSVVGTSSNTTLIPNANIVMSGTSPNCTAVITPAANKNGSATITMTVTDNGTPMPAETANRTFTMTVVPVIDLSGALTAINNLSGIASSYSANVYGKQMNFGGITADEDVSTFEICLGTASGTCDVSAWIPAIGYTTSGSAPTVNVLGSYRMKSGVDGAQIFSLLPSCSSTNDYYYSVRASNSGSRISNTLSTPAWSFWEPTCLGSSVLLMWLDASETSTITIASGVSNWSDKSGNNRTVTQSIDANKPAYSINGIGTGFAGVTFNGTSTTLMRNSFIYAEGSASIFTVIKGAAPGASRYIVSEGQSAVSGNNYYAPMAVSGSGMVTGRSVNDAATSELNLPVTSSVLFDGSIRLVMTEDSGSTFYTYSDGVAQSQGIFNYTRGASTIDTFRLGARYRTQTESSWFTGTVGEFIVTDRVLTTTQREMLEGYSAHKWEVNGNLPVAHPYSTTPP